jgi:hypothetical protein
MRALAPQSREAPVERAADPNLYPETTPDSESTDSLLEAETPGASSPSPVSAPKVKHSSDFSEVVWFGRKYKFKSKMQRGVIKILYEEWDTTGQAISQATLGERLADSKCRAGSSPFRLDHVFRNTSRKTYHPAWRKMIRMNTDGLCFLHPAKESQ